MKKIVIILILTSVFAACKQKAREKELTTNLQTSTNDEISFINAINYTALNTDSIKIQRNEIAELEFDFSENTEGTIFKVNFKNKNDTLKIQGEMLEFYLEEDFNNDGVNEIGILPGFKTSACRMYKLYDISNGKWKKLAETSTHLLDRSKGVNYFSKDNENIKITSASENCCCQCECYNRDTIVRVQKGNKSEK
jgi:hypothetical protein